MTNTNTNTNTNRQYLVLDCWGEPAHAYIGDTAHYKLGTERCGTIADISGDSAKINNMWHRADHLWME